MYVLILLFVCRSGQHLPSLNCLVPESDGPCYEAMPPVPAMRLVEECNHTCDPQQPCNRCGNDSSNAVTSAELALLAKLEEANRLIESDAKSLNSLSGASASGHSRKSSDTSQISLTSGMCNNYMHNLIEC